MKRKNVAWRKTLQKDVPVEERERKLREYRKVKNYVKRLIKEAKSRKDEELGEEVK